MSQFRKVTTFRRNQKSRNRQTNSGHMPQSNSRRHHEPNGVRPQCSPDCPRQRTEIEIEPRRIQGHFVEDFMIMPTDQGCVAQIQYSPQAPPIVLAQSKCHSEQNQRQSLHASSLNSWGCNADSPRIRFAMTLDSAQNDIWSMVPWHCI